MLYARVHAFSHWTFVRDSRLPHQLDSNSRIFILFLQCSVSPTSLSPRLLCEHAYALSGSDSTIIYEPRKNEVNKKNCSAYEFLCCLGREEKNLISLRVKRSYVCHLWSALKSCYDFSCPCCFARLSREKTEKREEEKKRESQWCHVSPSETIVGDGEQSECRTIQQWRA